MTLSRVTGRWQTGSPVVQAWALTDQCGQGALSLRPQIAVLPGTVLLEPKASLFQGVSQKQPVPTLLPSGGLAEAVGVILQIGCQGGKGTGHSHATHIPVGVNSALACRCQLQQSPSGTGAAPHAFGLLVWLGVDMISWTLQTFWSKLLPGVWLPSVCIPSVTGSSLSPIADQEGLGNSQGY